MSSISIVITTYGDPKWGELAWSRAYPSCIDQGADEVIVHHSDLGSIGPARNEAIAQAKSDWIVNLDADDELHSEYVWAMRREIERLAPTTRKERLAKRLFTPSVQYVRRGRPQDPMTWPEVDLRTGNWMVIGTMISRGFFKALGGFRDYPHGLEDFDLWSRSFKAHCRIEKVPRSIYICHWNEQSQHRQLQRKRKAYMKEYHRVVRSNWPELYEEATA